MKPVSHARGCAHTPGVAVGLELDAHRPAAAAPCCRGWRAQHAGQVLDVMAVLVREHVGLGERRRPRRRAVTAGRRRSRGRCRRTCRPGSRTGPTADARAAAAGRDLPVEEPRARRRVALAVRRQRRRPVGLDAVDDADDAAVLPLGRRRRPVRHSCDDARCSSAPGVPTVWSSRPAEARPARRRRCRSRSTPKTSAATTRTDRGQPAASEPPCRRPGRHARRPGRDGPRPGTYRAWRRRESRAPVSPRLAAPRPRPPSRPAPARDGSGNRGSIASRWSDDDRRRRRCA